MYKPHFIFVLITTCINSTITCIHLTSLLSFNKRDVVYH